MLCTPLPGHGYWTKRAYCIPNPKLPHTAQLTPTHHNPGQTTPITPQTSRFFCFSGLQLVPLGPQLMLYVFDIFGEIIFTCLSENFKTAQIAHIAG